MIVLLLMIGLAGVDWRLKRQRAGGLHEPVASRSSFEVRTHFGARVLPEAIVRRTQSVRWRRVLRASRSSLESCATATGREPYGILPAYVTSLRCAVVSCALRAVMEPFFSRRLPHRKKICSTTVRDDFNDLTAVIHYTRAAHELGLWESERLLIERFFPDRTLPLIEAGCGAGRVTLGLWALGYRNLTAFDFADELLDQARSLAAERGAEAIRFVQADATRLDVCHTLYDKPGTATRRPKQPPLFGGALFMFNGLMQIPGRENRRAALRGLHSLCEPGAPLLFTTHDRDASRTEQALWRLEARRWERGEQDPRLVEFGDRYFEEAGTGRTFMHLPTRREVLEDLAACGWKHEFDALRSELASESAAVVAFSDECRFWAARSGPRG